MSVLNQSKSFRNKKANWAVFVILILGLLAGFFVWPPLWNKPVDWLNKQAGTEILPQFFNRPFRLGLDLRGGTHLVYEADVSSISRDDISASMQGVRDVIERRVNLFGVAEPVVQVDEVGSSHRLIVELAGVRDTHQAIEMIGQTPSLDFRTEKSADVRNQILSEQEKVRQKIESGEELTAEDQAVILIDPYFEPTSLTGRFLKGAQLTSDQQTLQWQVGLEFNDEGSRLFEELTRQNVGQRLAIYLDGAPISAPTVQEAITGGKAQITGNFSVQEARELVQRLNAGALPVPITLISQQNIGSALGEKSLRQSLLAALIGILAVALFMIGWYRLPGFLAVIALLIYTAFALLIFKLIPVTLTLAGIAGFVLSVGMAVDANVLIFERMREELRWGKPLASAIEEGFKRAWTSIRDSNVSSLITCGVLFWLGTSIIKGFALTLAIGILISMFSAIIVTRNFLRLVVNEKIERKGWLFGVQKKN
ncbi:MAG: protein translocase subunit SecD [Candidatus Portnoybacteria bacterium CG_4_8_14_3_um_filter_44_15]|uniref:Protein translocase subunit SecD n=4 Tax=Candidatus Portnoyibacteriota TaxID=1817913 RepID=A0A2M7YMC4_9BACT|nr:MAG: protein translocase subunit SecD [Candidatus Portnoybacteria bacterium CG23_combo_of_CG06-09_8_20_14_all_44_36]PIW74749.1 MAG: protein translocase subunit SecD [Candidatus Portnoybacteria bacterium CG_4_8_14_3_um_filter_44_15]PIZ69678.1 MAG: protein translocase subunit SecD [Candidatus Portnoybacteria bacterium CG_4_10_14_0_2_um_filter_43_36]PJA64100.1 MAG: protein translocase subunit SecD [Candidatus Portnoybacteria bacterium CG_4_9_14_3_um_filter_43_11]PJE59055.1 MAG: protein transloc